MTDDPYKELFSDRTCVQLMPASTADEFFEALFGDASEGSYDLKLTYLGSDAQAIRFAILLEQRPGRCLACNLTYGLPQVFSRHPVININGIVAKIDAIIGDRGNTGEWRLGPTSERSRSLHAIELSIDLR